MEMMPCNLHFFNSRCPNFFRIVLALNCHHIGRKELPDAVVIGCFEISPDEFWIMIDSGEIHEPAAYVAAIFAMRRGYLPVPGSQ